MGSAHPAIPTPLETRVRRSLLALSWIVLVLVVGLPPLSTHPAPRAFAQGSAPLPVPQELVPSEMPPLATDVATRMRPYLAAQAAAFMDWHPERREILVSARAGEVRQLHLVKSPEARRIQVTSTTDPVRGARWNPAPSSPLVAYEMDSGGSEFYQVHVLDMETRKDRVLTDGKSRHEGSLWSRDGRALAWTGTARNGTDHDVYVCSLEEGATPRRVYESKGAWNVLDWSPDGKSLLIRQVVSIRASTLCILDLATGKATPLPRPRESTVMASGRWSRDGRSIYYTSDQGSEFVHIWRHDLDSARSVDLTPSLRWDVDELAISRDGHRLAWVINEDGYDRLHLADISGPAPADLSRPLPVPELARGLVGRLRFHPRTNELAFDVASASTPGETWSWNAESKALTRWTHVRTQGLDLKRCSEPSLVRYGSFDGRRIPAFVYRPGPPRSAPFPVLISIHGGPEGQHRPGFLGHANYYVNEMGVAVVYPNVRGSTGYGKTWVDLDNGERREDSVKDISALLDWIATQPDLDPTRVAVEGGSYGGFMSLATMVRESGRLRCGVDVVGISDFVTFLERTQAYRRDLRRVEYGDERDPRMRAFLERVSPLRQASRISKPLFVVQGANDPRVPRSEAEQIVREVRRGGHPVWYLLAMNEGHGFARRKNIEYYQAAKAVFLDTYLLPARAAR